MPKVQMLATKPGSPDGINMITYKEGETYTIPDDLYRCFKEMGVVKKLNEKPVSTPENKAEKNTAENKSALTEQSEDEDQNSDGKDQEAEDNDAGEADNAQTEVSGEAKQGFGKLFGIKKG